MTLRAAARRGWLAGLAVAAVIAGTAGCQSGIGPDPRRSLATSEAYETRVAALERQIGEQQATLAALTPPPATPTPRPFTDRWRIEITGPIERTPRLAENAGRPLTARGEFLVVPIAVTNLSGVPAPFNPAAALGLLDGEGRRYDVDPVASGAAYLLDLGLRPDFGPRQPGIAYPDVVVFDLPPEAADLTLVARDGSLAVDLPLPSRRAATPAPPS